MLFLSSLLLSVHIILGSVARIWEAVKTETNLQKDMKTCRIFIAGVRSPERPVVPNITALSTTEVRITWCRVNSNKVEIDHYELFIDSELEYSGIDVMYVAKRLKPWSWYEVKLRACGFSPGSCSPFSRPALVKTLRDSKCCTTILITTSGTACYTYSFALSQNFYSTTVWQAKRVHIYLFTVL